MNFAILTLAEKYNISFSYSMFFYILVQDLEIHIDVLCLEYVHNLYVIYYVNNIIQ